MNHKYFDKIVLSQEAFGDELYNILGQLMKILLAEGYECLVYDEDVGIIVIEFNYSPRMHFGGPEPMWLNKEEAELICQYRYEQGDIEEAI